MIRRNSWLLILLLAGGCEVGPNYKPPQVTVNPAWTESSSTEPSDITATTQPASVGEWWSNFNDPELNSLVDRAIRNNLDLHNAYSRVVQAREQRGVTGSELFPVINADGGYQAARGSSNVTFPLSAFGITGSPSATPSVATPNVAHPNVVHPSDVSVAPIVSPGGPQSPLGDGGIPNADTQIYQAGFDASWEVDVFGGHRREIEAADADTAAAIEDHRDVMISLVSELARDYIELRASQRQSRIAADNLKDQQDELELTQSRYKAGFSTDLDVCRESAQVATTAAILPQLEGSQRQMIHQIAILLGQDPDSLTAELSAAQPIPPAPMDVPVGAPSDLLQRRPDIRRAERELAAATARIGAAEADYFPKFSITGSFGLDSSKAQNLLDWNSRYFAISPGATWPIFDAGRIKHNVNVQKSLAAQAATDYQETVLNALREVEDALASCRTEQIRRKALADAVDASTAAVAIARQQYEQGVVDFLQVLDAQRSLLEAQDSLTQSDSAISTDMVALYKALGGGWDMSGRKD
ncbi:MAG: efflux transporter outer membrane subunit [Tepidisphaeraceae bacterium]